MLVALLSVGSAQQSYAQIIQSCASGGASTAIGENAIVQTGPNSYAFTFTKTPNGNRSVKLVVRNATTNVIVFTSPNQNYQGPGPFTINFSPTPATPLNQLVLTIGIANNNQHTTALNNATNPGNGCNFTVLPVKLVNFSLKPNNGGIMLNWATSLEVNALGFDIERRTKDSYEKVGFVPAINNANGSNYSFQDNQLIQGNVYYRLKMIDKDGKFSYSDVKMISQGNSGSVLIYPNPSYGEVKISVSEAGANYKGSIWTSTGKQVTSFTINNNAPFLYNNLIPGTYIVKLVGSKTGKEETHKLVVVR